MEGEAYSFWKGPAQVNPHHKEGDYFFIGVKPVEDRQLTQSLIPEFGKVYDLFGDDELAEYWGVYLKDLAEIFDCPEGGWGPVLPSEFFSSYGKQMLDSVCYYHGNVDPKYVKWELKNYQKVAEAHRFSLSRDRVSEGLIRITAALSMLV